MFVLRLDQTVQSGGGHQVAVEFSGPAVSTQRVSAQTTFVMTGVDHERVRWYLEDYLEYPVDPGPAVARAVEARLAALGEELFTAVFGSGDGVRLWGRVQDKLSQTRIEVATDVSDAVALPWELLRDPATGTPLALEAASFVRVNHATARPISVGPIQSADGTGRLRVLLVICRPAGPADVPFRSVAGRLVRAGGEAGRVLDLQVLRPPTFARLMAVLEAACRARRPFHVVHFDGHGTYLDAHPHGDGAPSDGGLNRHRYAGRRFVSPLRPGRHGYLLFEDSEAEANEQVVDGPALGALLARTGVAVLVLNACRSAYAEAPSPPTPAGEVAAGHGAGEAAAGPAGAATAADVHARVRAYGSLALEVTDAGVAGVVAMRYSVYVVTAAKFVTDLYAALLSGRSLGDAVAVGRRQLAAQPNRSIAFDPVPLQDWTVPVVYESTPLTLFSADRQRSVFSVDGPGWGLNPATTDLPRPPDVGFFGRDETLLALDRAFDRHTVVLLHGYAGQGKTSTAAEFARWYAATGGLTCTDGVVGAGSDPDGSELVVFSSLEQYTPLRRLLDQLADTVTPAVYANDIGWQALDDGQCRRMALQLLDAVPVLWIWDNVEQVAGFPTPTDSPWTLGEQRELADFLRDVGRTRARVLITSRRDEHGWLGEVPARVVLPAMPMRERIQLARALADKRGHGIGDVEDWRPLLRYAAGNPLTITVLVGQALRDGYTSRTDIERLVARLRAGEGDLGDDEERGRDRSLAASLRYGFATGFTDVDRARLGVLHLFQDTVDVAALVHMGHPHNPYRVVQLADLTPEEGVALLDRAAEVGLLTALGGGHYSIHPALPWYFRRLTSTAGADAVGADTAGDVEAAYATAVANLGERYYRQYEQGRHEVIGWLRDEEANLLHARALARRAGRWNDVIGCMQGLRALYQHAGHGTGWARLVDEVVPDLIDPATGGPHEGRDAPWEMLTEYRIRIAMAARDWSTGEQLARASLAHHRTRAADALATPADRLTDRDRHRIRQLVTREQILAYLLRERHDPACVAHFEQVAGLCRRIGARREEGMIAFNLGHVYKNLPQLRDLDRAEYWYRQDLDLMDEHDRIGRAKTTMQLGSVAYERFRDARQAGQPDEVGVDHLTSAAALYEQALADLPADAVFDLAITHHQLGVIYADADLFEAALRNFQQAIRYDDRAGNRHGSGLTRERVAILLASTGRTGDALLYARAALRDFESFGRGATDNIDKVRRFIAGLEQTQIDQPST